MAKKRRLFLGIFYSLRPFQWVKNLAVFAAIIFNGKLFDVLLFHQTLLTFASFCLVSSASYLINDVIDAPYDRHHPLKRNRPIARGDISPMIAEIIAGILALLGLITAVKLGWLFVILIVIFFLLHMLYSLYLKRVAVLDILLIAIFFILRALGGEIATGYHLPIWLIFTVVFLALFIASGKRRSELIIEGPKTRPSLMNYGKALLNFYTSIFAVATLISYSLFAYFTQPISFNHPRVRGFLLEHMPYLLGRKWLMITIFPVIFGIMRYSQLVFEKKEGQRPEQLLISDIPLTIIVLTWGLMTILIIYVL